MKKKEKLLLITFLSLILLAFFPAVGILGNSNQLILGIPLSVLWLLVDFILLVVLSIIAYITIFRQWAIEIDKRL
ncbi:MAG TPA: hypothetical protein EYG73_04585 [Arcobacter sp.]|nr:hypothetical protein [Arcobacter sp.]